MAGEIKAVRTSHDGDEYETFLPVQKELRDYEIKEIKVKAGLLEVTDCRDSKGSFSLKIDGKQIDYITGFELRMDDPGDFWKAKVEFITDPRVVKK